ncbi:MAG: response regulator [Chloroflexota bacterium]
MHIIYVEDNPNDRRFVERVLTSQDHQITTGRGLDEVSAVIREADIILIDILLDGEPKGSRYPEQLREMGIEVPCIAVTARVTRDEAKDYLASGFHHVLPKPFTAVQLVDLIENFS